ncbi:MAG: transcription termination/antitermination protein NusG, partial [Thermoanaerobaculaceae bacterium]|nr:transcription termination/antitermination protein NusG [Thermoanaerobaculaceae bacterium]
VDRIMSNMTKSSESPKPKVVFEVGEKVKINDGPFASFQGVVESINFDKGTLTVMVTIFGRSTPVELNFLQVEKI